MMRGWVVAHHPSPSQGQAASMILSPLFQTLPWKKHWHAGQQEQDRMHSAKKTQNLMQSSSLLCIKKELQ